MKCGPPIFSCCLCAGVYVGECRRGRFLDLQRRRSCALSLVLLSSSCPFRQLRSVLSWTFSSTYIPFKCYIYNRESITFKHTQLRLTTILVPSRFLHPSISISDWKLRNLKLSAAFCSHSKLWLVALASLQSSDPASSTSPNHISYPTQSFLTFRKAAPFLRTR